MFRSTLLLRGRQRGRVTRVTMTLTLTQHVARVALRRGPRRNEVIKENNRIILRRSMANKKCQITNVIIRAYLITRRLLCNSIMMTLILSTIVVNNVTRSTLLSRRLITRTRLLRLCRLRSTNDNSRLKCKYGTRRRIKFRASTPFLIYPSRSANVRRKIITNSSRLNAISFPSLRMSLSSKVRLLMYLSLNRNVNSKVISVCHER